MKEKRTFLLIGLIIFVALVFILNRNLNSSQESQSSEPTLSKFSSPREASSSHEEQADLNSLIREVSTQVPRRANAAGHVIIASADTSDKEATDALLRSFARGEDHLNHMRRENAFVTRRQIVELPETFTEVGNRINRGEKIDTIIIPDFDGGTFEVKYNPRLMGPAGEDDGTLLGKIPDEEASDVILGYYKDSTSGYVNLPIKNRVLEYMTVGGKQIVIKEIDLAARNIAEPCGICQQANGKSDHPAGRAHNLATGFGQHAP